MRYTVFNHISNNEERIEEFEKFFIRFELEPLFTYENRMTSVTVGDIDLRAVINGRYTEDLKKLSDFIHIADDNKMYNSALFKMLYKQKTFSNFMKIVRKINDYIEHGIDENRMGNTWNIVWYNEDLY